MAARQAKLEAGSPSKTTGGTVVRKKREGTVRSGTTKTRARKNGVEQLRQEVDRRVGRNSKELAGVLMDKALAGDLASVKVLFGLAERKKPMEVPSKKRSELRVAERLSLEPSWSEEKE
jgi:hypothetical protein